MSLIWNILSHGIRHGGRTAIVDDQRSYTYREILGASLFVGEEIESSTAWPRVGVLLPTSGGFALAMLGAWLAEKSVVPINYLLKPADWRHIFEDSGIDTVVTNRRFLDYLGGRECLPEDRIEKIIFLEDLDYTGMPPLRWPPIFNHDRLAAVLYTSGTSGKPKGVMLTHRNFESMILAGIEHARFSHANKFFGMLPQFHSFGFSALTILPLYLGASVVYTARFHPRKAVQMLREHRPDTMIAIPSMWGTLLQLKDATQEDFMSLHYPVSGGEPLPDATFNGMKERFGVTLLEGYGLTETAPVTHWSTPSAFKRGSVGKALPCVQVVIADEELRPLPTNEEGEILLAGPNVMQGYLNRPDETDQAFVDVHFRTEEAWVSHRFYRTGDIGRVDEEGFLFITGRKKDMMVVGGENVFPREIEEVLNHHEAVEASGVVGKHDGVRGEVPVAFVRLIEGQSATPEELRAYCREHLGSHQVPREVRILEELPTSPTGKVLRRALRDQVQQDTASQPTA